MWYTVLSEFILGSYTRFGQQTAARVAIAHLNPTTA